MNAKPFPVYLCLEGRRCLVVGDGPKTWEKVKRLRESGALVTVVVPPPGVVPAELRKDSKILVHERPFDPSDVEGKSLVISTPEDPGRQREVSRAAHQAGVLNNAMDQPDLCEFVFGAALERGDLQLTLSTNGRFPLLATKLCDRISKRLPPATGEAVRVLGAAREQAYKEHPGRPAILRERLEELLSPEVLQNIEEGNLEALRDRIQKWSSSPARWREPRFPAHTKSRIRPGPAKRSSGLGGSVFLVGAGPGDPSLLTCKALRLLQKADIVFHDALIPRPILSAIPPGVRRVPVGRRKSRIVCGQEELHRRLIAWARRGATVVRLQGGDPLLFGRAGEEIAALRRAGIDVKVIPGVTAASAAAAALSATLTERGLSSSCVFVTAHVASPGGLEEIRRAARSAQTLAIYMGATIAGAVGRVLLEAGREAGEAVAVVERATLPQEQVHRLTLGELASRSADDPFRRPALILVGPTLPAQADPELPRSTSQDAENLESPAHCATTRQGEAP